MKIVKPGWSFEKPIVGGEVLRFLERVGRTCYKTEEKITDESHRKFVRQRIDDGHEAVIEFEDVTVRVICDRGVTHEIVRHRIASYAQESTRYCNYKSDVQIIQPFFFPEDEPTTNTIGPDDETILPLNSVLIWMMVMQMCEWGYKALIARGRSPQEARSVLPNSLKTEIVMKMNLREWRHFFRLRTSKKAHPQMREITIPMLAAFKEAIPIVFDDIVAEE